jgi:hypothetical protein
MYRESGACAHLQNHCSCAEVRTSTAGIDALIQSWASTEFANGVRGVSRGANARLVLTRPIQPRAPLNKSCTRDKNRKGTQAQEVIMRPKCVRLPVTGEISPYTFLTCLESNKETLLSLCDFTRIFPLLIKYRIIAKSIEPARHLLQIRSTDGGSYE